MKKNISLLLLITAIGIILGVCIGYIFRNSPTFSLTVGQDFKNAKWETIVAGDIQEIKTDSIILKYGGQIFTVTIGPETKFFRQLSSKEIESLKKDRYIRPELGESIPLEDLTTEITLKDLNVGNTLSIVSNISNNDLISAIKIIKIK